MFILLFGISVFILFFLFLSLFCLVAPQVALSTVPTVQVANSKRGRRAMILIYIITLY